VARAAASKTSGAPKVTKPRFNARLWLRVVLWSGIFAGAAYGAKEVHSFLLSDPRFEFRNLELRGAVYTSRERLQGVFAPDAHLSVFHMPLAERRRHLLAIDWVRTATIERVWPNRIVVTITERTPVAFARLPMPGSQRHWLALIDEEGILLSIPPKTRFSLPVLSGITEEQTDEDRRARVDSMQHLLADLGPQAKDISEVNAASAQDIRVIADVEGQGLELWLGDQHFRSRYVNFLNHYGEIKSHSENARIFDLRMDDRISTR
jgi:cell division protein FtsQ